MVDAATLNKKLDTVIDMFQQFMSLQVFNLILCYNCRYNRNKFNNPKLNPKFKVKTLYNFHKYKQMVKVLTLNKILIQDWQI